MLDFLTIFSKSGIVLFTTVNPVLNNVVNKLIKHVLLEERAGLNGKYQAEQLQLQYAIDNEFEMVFVVGFQKLLNLKYIDKFLTDMQRALRDRYPNFDMNACHDGFAKCIDASAYNKDISQEQNNSQTQIKLDYCDLVIDLENCLLTGLTTDFRDVYKTFVGPQSSFNVKQETMRTFQDSAKSKKTIASMIIQPEIQKEVATKQQTRGKEFTKQAAISKNIVEEKVDSIEPKRPIDVKVGGIKKAKKSSEKTESKKKGKAARQWELEGSNPDEFDFSKKNVNSENESNKGDNTSSINKNIASVLGATEVNLEMTDDDESGEEEEEDENKPQTLGNGQIAKDIHLEQKSTSYFSTFRKFISLDKKLTQEDLKPVLEQLKEHLTTKNVAAEIAEKLCESVCAKLEGQTIDSWTSLSKIARKGLEDVVLQILNPNRNINILREVQAKRVPPYVIVFCGVNGVGKSTNLAKIANWLINNKVKVLVVACDTFRSGAIEQLRTHVQALKSIHERQKDSETKIELFEKGYGKDGAAIAMDGIKHAKNRGFNCVLVDTAGRMQDNEPLMKQLAKLIMVNQPDLTLFVGEALVGNEAVDQLSKFNQSLISAGCIGGESRSAINGIVLTKFDTIDDQVGAAISMTYVTGQPIVFVGVGQTYRDLKQLDAKAVTKALMR